MKYFLICGVFLLLMNIGGADEFFLTDSTGIKYGPFDFREGEKITLTGQEFTISKVLTKEQMTIENLKALIIPHLEFRQAKIVDVMKYLHHASIVHDSTTNRNLVLSFVLNLKTQQVMQDVKSVEASSNDLFFSTSDSGLVKVPLITLSASNISLYDALNIICKKCDLQLSIKDCRVVIEPKEREKDQLSPQPDNK